MTDTKDDCPFKPTKEWLRANDLFLQEFSETHETFSRENVLRYTDAAQQDAFDEGIKEGILLALRFLSSGNYRCSRDYDSKLKRSKSVTDRAVGVRLISDNNNTLADQYFKHVNQ
ncbi:hypothetical protein [Pseudomonas phage PA1C]|nr:hypothetical protein [Pseudomonas phage PA1C]BEG72559.1 hypothetical protein RVBP21_1870 [Pseudomonas phage BRkr]